MENRRVRQASTKQPFANEVRLAKNGHKETLRVGGLDVTDLQLDSIWVSEKHGVVLLSIGGVSAVFCGRVKYLSTDPGDCVVYSVDSFLAISVKGQVMRARFVAIVAAVSASRSCRASLRYQIANHPYI